ncbi:MAG: hypothetical protein NTZ32_11420 [Planctomycetales bacterium]|nr:hypothetical protein [Planctomycetales bacterium]
MPDFDTFDICEAHYQLEVDYNLGGWLHERPSNQRRMEATHVQLHRMHEVQRRGWMERLRITVRERQGHLPHAAPAVRIRSVG